MIQKENNESNVVDNNHMNIKPDKTNFNNNELNFNNKHFFYLSNSLSKFLKYEDKKNKQISLSFPDYSNLSTKKSKNQTNKNIQLKTQNQDFKKEMKKLFYLKKEDLIYEIEYFCNNPSFNYDFEHQRDNNSNFNYINENFIDILLLSHKRQLILKKTINPIKQIQTKITFNKRNILISWLTEINMKYIKNQNILFSAVKYLDKILYKENININEFQLIGILCLNLATKLENSQKVMRINEIMSLTTNVEERDTIRKEMKLINHIKRTEMKVCNILNFEFGQSTSVMILHRLIQLLNIRNKKIENIFTYISNFFLEISLYDEDFYYLEEFTKALSCVVLTKLILEQKNIQIGFHKFLKHCVINRKNEIKRYLYLCQNYLKESKNLKYMKTLICKYQMSNFNCIAYTFLSEFIKIFF